MIYETDECVVDPSLLPSVVLSALFCKICLSHLFNFCIAANFVLLPYYTFNYLVSSSGEGLRSPLADKSLLLLLILIHYRKCIIEDESITNPNVEAIGGNSYMKETYFYENPYCKALNSVRDVECKAATVLSI